MGRDLFMEWMKPALVFMALSSVVVAASFLYVWLSLVRRRYVFMWAGAWLVAVPNLALTGWLMDHPGSHVAWSLQLIFAAINTQLVAAGCYDFVHRRFPLRAVLAVSTGALAWALLAPVAFDKFFE